MKQLLWLKFYPKDWNGDHQLRGCSLAARGLLASLLEPMHTAEPYGYLLLRGKKPDYCELAVIASCKLREVKYGLEELVRKGVLSVRDDGVMFSRRMVRDAERRDRGRANGELGGNPTLKAGVNPHVNGVASPIVSGPLDSPPLSLVKERNDAPMDVLFDRFQSAYPAHRRQGDYLTQTTFVDACGLVGFDTLMAALEQHKRSEQWQSPKLVIGMRTWLMEKRWNQVLPEPSGLSDKGRASVANSERLLDRLEKQG